MRLHKYALENVPRQLDHEATCENHEMHVWDSRRLFERGQTMTVIGLLRRCALTAGYQSSRQHGKTYQVIARLSSKLTSQIRRAESIH